MPAASDRPFVGTGAHLDSAELHLWTRFLDAGRLIEQILAKDLTANHSMTHGDYEVLVRLDGAGGSMRLTMLADQCVSSKSKLTHTLNRIEERGWILRQPVSGDGRGVEAVITDVGAERLRTAAIDHAMLIKKHLLANLTKNEQAVVGRAMDRVSTRIRAERAGR